MNRCRFCGGKVTSDAVSCEHCGKQLRKTASTEQPRRVTNIESWKDKAIPSWLMFLVVGIFLACFVIMFLDANDAETEPKPVEPADASQTTQPNEPMAPADQMP